jgi:sugar lactone lactonase YvrE
VEGPIALCVDRAGRIWVGASNHLVQLFSPTGEYLVGMGGGGHTPGKFDTPHGLAIDSHGFLYAVDTMNGRIQKFAVT